MTIGVDTKLLDDFMPSLLIFLSGFSPLSAAQKLAVIQADLPVTGAINPTTGLLEATVNIDLGNNITFHTTLNNKGCTIFLKKNKANKFLLPSIERVFDIFNDITGASLPVELPDPISSILQGVSLQDLVLTLFSNATDSTNSTETNSSKPFNCTNTMTNNSTEASNSTASINSSDSGYFMQFDGKLVMELGKDSVLTEYLQLAYINQTISVVKQLFQSNSTQFNSTQFKSTESTKSSELRRLANPSPPTTPQTKPGTKVKITKTNSTNVTECVVPEIELYGTKMALKILRSKHRHLQHHAMVG